MEKRIFDLLLGLFLGQIFAPTITAFGFSVSWALLGLIIMIMIRLFKKLGQFFWTKLVKWSKEKIVKWLKEEVIKELKNDLN